MDDDTRFVWIDYCSEFKNDTNANILNATYCVMLGRGGISHKIIPLDAPKKLSTEKIYSYTDPLPFEVKRIAHAGGAYNTMINTNSLDALTQNYEKGFRYFELDFHFTSDNRIVCMHDWNRDLKRTFHINPPRRLSYEEFNEHVEMHPLYTRCTLESLEKWLTAHPDARIITDFKEHNKEGLLLLTRLHPTQQQQFIPQIYDPNNQESIRQMGYEHTIWTLYRFSGPNEDVVYQLKKQGNISAVTMPRKRAQSRLPTELKQLNIPTYTHTINDPTRAERLLEKYNITEIYTDTLPPKIKE
jgi:glycerophosphoryl diester phosphodiesterase